MTKKCVFFSNFIPLWLSKKRQNWNNAYIGLKCFSKNEMWRHLLFSSLSKCHWVLIEEQCRVNIIYKINYFLQTYYALCVIFTILVVWKNFQTTLILVFEVIVQPNGNIFWHFQVRPKSWKSYIVWKGGGREGRRLTLLLLIAIFRIIVMWMSKCSQLNTSQIYISAGSVI